MAQAKIKAFTLRHKKSKAGTPYFIAPYGDVDLLGFISPSGDIEVSYVEREARPGARPAQTAPSAPQPAPRPKIIPRESPPAIRERPVITPRQQLPPEPMAEDLPDWMNEAFVPDEQGY